MICLKNRTFAVSQTTKISLKEVETCCDLLEKSYFCSITNNSSFMLSLFIQLWFAWKIVLLQYHKQQLVERLRKYNRCDLLEKSYFCSITNNWKATALTSGSVVICLKNRTFAVSQTTLPLAVFISMRCDLLEKSYFCSITNNRSRRLSGCSPVVICLKNRTFAVSQTTNAYLTIAHVMLWFAWKIVLLQYHKQLLSPLSSANFSCDLLEKSYFCSITNNWACSFPSTAAVVICLKNRTFAVSQTTQGG